MFYFFIIFISLLCPSVTAQVSNDYAQEQFSGYIDVLIGFMVPFVIFVLADYEYDDDGSKTLACLARSFVFLINIGLQQEIAFTISSVEISNFIKILQHIVTGSLGLQVILNFIYYMSTEENKSIKKDYENYFNKNFEEYFNLNFDKRIQPFESEIQPLKEKVEKITQLENKFQTHEDKIQTHETKFFILEKQYKTLEGRIRALENNVPFRQLLSNIVPAKPSKVTSEIAMKIFPSNFTTTDKALVNNNDKPESPKIIKIFIRTLYFLNYSALILFTIILGFLLGDLKENVTQSFIIALIITISLTFIFHTAIILLSIYKKNLENYIKKFQDDHVKITFKYHVYIDIIADFISINTLYLPSLINCFLLQTPGIFNKLFLNLSALLVTTWIVLMYKNILKGEEEKEGVNDNKEKKEEENNSEREIIDEIDEYTKV